MNRWARGNKGRKKLVLASLVWALAGYPATTAADAAQAAHEFQLSGGSLSSALTTYPRVTGRQLLYPSALVAGRNAPRLHGRFTADEALRRLLSGTNIGVRRAGRNVFVLSAAVTAERRPQRLAQRRVQPQPASPPPPPPAPDPAPAPGAGDEDAPEEIVVTGSNIRGLTEGASQVITVNRENIERSGYGTVAEALAALPQNFGGTATEDASLTGVDRTIPNNSLGSSVNLRGLGSDATLTLVNGRRVAGSGGKGDFTDLSTIPTGAVERIEVLTDGASALYGSDAIGGVVNVILRKSIDGGETRLRAGTVTRGGTQDYQIGQLLGTRWSSGHILGAYEFQRRENLEADDRPYTRSQDLRPLGGNDFRGFFSNPGTIVAFDPVSGGFVPRFAIPEGQDGTDLDPADFRPGANFQNQLADTDVLPRQTRHSGYAFVEQEIGSTVRLFAEGRYAHRRFSFLSPPSTALLQVTPANPFFVSPDGSPFSLVAYSFADDLGPIEVGGTVESWSATGGGSVETWGDWAIDAYVTRATEKSRGYIENIVQSTYLNEALGVSPDNPATDFSTAENGFFNPYGDGAVNNQAILDFIGQGFSNEQFESRLTSFNVKADGSLYDLPGGAVRAALGATYRREAFFRSGESFFFGAAPRPFNETDADRSIKAVFAEVLVPLFSATNAKPGLRRLDLSAAIRHEDYSDFGSTTDPKVGVVWEPIRGLSLRGSYGTSFRAPALREVGDPTSVSPTQLFDASGRPRFVLFLTGGNPDLGPERARSLTLGAKLAPPGMPGFRAEATYFHTRFNDRIGQPTFEDVLNALRDEVYSPFVQFVSPATDPEDLALVTDLVNQAGSAVPPFLRPEAFGAIVDGRFVNTAKVVVRGVDLTLSHSFTLGEARAAVGLNSSYLFDYKRQITPVAPLVERVDTIGNPVDFRLRATGNLDWRDWGATASINYVDSLTDDVSVPARRVDSRTTVDLQLRYEPKWRGWAEGLTLSLSVQNLFDTDPPFVNRSLGYAYDVGNADPLDRFVALQLIKRW